MSASDIVESTVTNPSDRFSIRLLFPDKKYPTMIYSVHAGMTVTTLRLQISELLEQVYLVHLLVGISWNEDRLRHDGTITDRVFPGTNTPCPFLQQGSRVLVHFTRPESESPEAPETVPIGLSSLDIAPAIGGWLSEPTKAAIKLETSQQRPERPILPKSDFFDDSYVRGKHVVARDKANSPINPIRQPSPTYSEVYTATLTTLTDIARHEERIYQSGYTPTAIRDNIQSQLRNSDPAQPFIDFQERDIPPPDRDVRTHRILTDLMQDRDRVNRDFQIPLEGVAADGTALGSTSIQEAYKRRDTEYNRLNRSMFQTYAFSAYVIHDRNFASYCKPNLRNIPGFTACKLENLKQSLRDKVMERPPYTTVQHPKRDTTQPVFSAPRPTYADVLKPRAEWMKKQPPFSSDKDADNTWRQGNERMFGVEESRAENLNSPSALTTPQLQERINDLQHELYLRTETEARAHQDSTLPFNSLAARVFRQGKRSISDESRKTSPDQSKSSGGQNFQSRAGESHQKALSPKNNIFLDQSAVASAPLFDSRTQSDSRIPETISSTPSSGRKKSTVRKPMGSLQLSRHVLAPYDAATIAGQRSRAKAEKANEKADAKQRDEAERGTDGKHHKVNDFGGGTFWNRPNAPRRNTSATSDALCAHKANPSPKTFIVDTGASHVLLQKRHSYGLTYPRTVLCPVATTLRHPERCKRTTIDSYWSGYLHHQAVGKLVAAHGYRQKRENKLEIKK